MPADFNDADPNFGVDPDAGTQEVKAVSPAEGVVPDASTSDGSASASSPASVLGTGDNADLVTYHQEAV